jgi:hypothetical protein
VHDHVGVAIGQDDADVGMRVDATHPRHVRRVDPAGEHSRDQVVEGRLAAFLAPVGGRGGVLHRKLQAIGGQVLYQWIVPQLI